MIVGRHAGAALVMALAISTAGVRAAAQTAADVNAVQEAPEAAAPVDAAKPSGPPVQTLGPDDQRLYLVDHGGTWSMHAESVVAGSLLHSWHEAGGPLVTSKVILDYPFTLSVHRTSGERILEHILEGWSYTLHYDAKGRLEAVRVYSPEPQRMFKTPRLTESFSAWRLIENGEPAAASPQNAAPAAAAPPPAN